MVFGFSLFLILFQSIISSAVLTKYKKKQRTAAISKFECIKSILDNTRK